MVRRLWSQDGPERTINRGVKSKLSRVRVTKSKGRILTTKTHTHKRDFLVRDEDLPLLREDASETFKVSTSKMFIQILVRVKLKK